MDDARACVRVHVDVYCQEAHQRESMQLVEQPSGAEDLFERQLLEADQMRQPRDGLRCTGQRVCAPGR